MTRNPHSEFLKYHGYNDVNSSAGIPPSDMDILRSEISEIKLTMRQVLQELRKLNT